MLGLLGFAFGLWFGYDRVPAALIWGIPSGLLVLGLVLQERAGAIPNWVRRSAWLGDSSYTLYLLHAILLPPSPTGHLTRRSKK